MVDLILLLPIIVAALIFPVTGWVCLRFMPLPVRMPLFAGINLAGAAALCVLAASHGVRVKQAAQFIPVAAAFFILYLFLIALQYVNLRFVRSSQAWAWLPLIYPVVLLAVVKYIPAAWNPLQAVMPSFGGKALGEFFLGLSYMAFRLSHMAQEVRNGIVKLSGPSEFLAFAFFVPTFSIGPINPYSNFSRSLHFPDPAVTPPGRSLMRIAIGAAKYLFIANVFNQLSYSGLLFDGHPHRPIDLAVAIFAYGIYLYTNFSGYCDIMIGVSGLLGIYVMENFQDPFLSRNLQEFWNRWHISLSTYARDMMFSPLTKVLIRKSGPRYANHMIALSIFCVFVAVGVWHGASWNWLLFGVWHGLGLAVCHYYTIFLKKRLGKKGYAAYQSNRGLHAAGVALTFVYFACGLLLVNPLPQIARIFRVVGW